MLLNAARYLLMASFLFGQQRSRVVMAARQRARVEEHQRSR